ncbi:cobalamin-dependent protein [Streptomyces sp. NPDC046203]|uniref:cobalamin B12-binding domain-containing protein n=1 Tax=Streptomyces sp. NPDC046203 TaxID=3154602 RepID=UPI00340B123A
MSLPASSHSGAPTASAGRRVLVSSVSSDSHTWNLVFLQLLLEDLGHEVTNIGSCVPDDLLIAEARRHRPDMMVISSVNGHGALDGGRLIRKLRQEPDLSDLKVVIGGKLGIRGVDGASHSEGLLDAGFDAVFEDAAGIEPFRRYLAASAPALEGAAR